MKRLIFSLLLALSAPALADAPPLQNPSANTVSVSAYGAACDGVTDDTAAINRATASFRARLAAGAPTTLEFPENRICRLSQPGGANFTALGNEAYDGVVAMRGSRFLCQTSGTACVDALGSYHLTWKDLSLVGAATDASRIGVQFGRTNAFVDAQRIGHFNACGEQRMENVHITGVFTIASVYEYSCETVTWASSHIENDYQGGGEAYAVILDGCNHWNIESVYVPLTVTANRCISFDENVFSNAALVRRSGDNTSGGVVWLAATIKHQINNSSYLAAMGTFHTIVLWDNGTGSNTGFVADLHAEGTKTKDVFFLTGENPSPALLGFTYIDQQSQAGSAIFVVDRGISRPRMTAGRITLLQPKTSNVRIFEAPSLWTVQADIDVAVASYWAPPAAFSGRVCIGGTCALNGDVGPATLGALPPLRAYSAVRRLILNYAGPIVKLRRSPDDATRAFYPDPFGNLQIASVLAWGGGGALHAVEIFDQTGRGCRIMQNNPSLQPEYRLASDGPSGRPAIAFDHHTQLSQEGGACNQIPNLLMDGGFFSVVADMAQPDDVTASIFQSGGITLRSGSHDLLAPNAAPSSGNAALGTFPFAVGQHSYQLLSACPKPGPPPLFAMDGASRDPAGPHQANSASASGAAHPGRPSPNGPENAGPVYFYEMIMWKGCPDLTVQESVLRDQATYYGLTMAQPK